jgi:hypothetical protein
MQIKGSTERLEKLVPKMKYLDVMYLYEAYDNGQTNVIN